MAAFVEGTARVQAPGTCSNTEHAAAAKAAAANDVTQRRRLQKLFRDGDSSWFTLIKHTNRVT